MVDFETIPNIERVDFIKAIADQVREYFHNPANAEKYETLIKKKSKSV